MASFISLERRIADSSTEPVVWSRPDEFDLSSNEDRKEIERRFESGEISSTIDRIDEIANDVFDVTHPAEVNEVDVRSRFVEDIHDQGLAYGKWFHFRWSQSLVRYADQEMHQEMRTFRNKNLVTEEEQRRLLGSTAVVFGLSVGSSVAEQLIMGGLTGTLVTGDPDRLSPTNLNRVRAGMPQVGMRKTDILACRVSEVDPYVDQLHFYEGVSQHNIDQLVEVKPDIIFDEVDDLATKAMLRIFAAKHRIPLVMATDLGDKSVIDVERHDEATTDPFGGRITQKELALMQSGEYTQAEKQKIMSKIVGLRHVSPRMIKSVMEIGDTLTGMPQLGTTASAGGALAAVAAREILLGNKMESGRYISSPKRTLNLQHQTGVREASSIISSFVRSKQTK